MVVSYCSNIPSTWQRHQVLSNLQVFCSAKVLYTDCVCVCVDLQCFPTNTVNMHVRLSEDSLGRPCLLRRSRRRVFLESLVGDVRYAVMEGDGGTERQGQVGFFSDFNDIDGRHRGMKLQQTNKGSNPYFILFTRNNEKYSS